MITEMHQREAEALLMMVEHLNKNATMTYQERILQTAEMMAYEQHKQSPDARDWNEWRNRYPATSSEYIDTFIPLATLAVQMQAEAIKHSYDAAWLFTSHSVEQRERYKMKFLLANGYMPQTEQK